MPLLTPNHTDNDVVANLNKTDEAIHSTSISHHARGSQPLRRPVAYGNRVFDFLVEGKGELEEEKSEGHPLNSLPKGSALWTPITTGPDASIQELSGREAL